jgi:hypothetical protein
MTKAIQAIVGMIISFGFALGQQPTDPSKSTMTGTVVYAPGAVIPGARVSLFRTTDNVPVAIIKTDGKGEFQFFLGEFQQIKLVAEALCFTPTVFKGVAGKHDEATKLPPIILQVSQECRGVDLDEAPPLPVVPVLFEIFNSLEPSKKVNIVTVCELLANINEYNNTDVAVVGRMDQPGDKLIDHSEYVVQDHCEHPIVTKGYVWPSKALIFSQGRLESLAKAPRDQPELDHTVLGEKASAVQKTTKLGFHKEPRLSQKGSVHFANVRDEWIVAYGRIFCAPNLAREACRNIGCRGFIGGAPLVIIVEPKNIHIISQDGKLRRASEQDGK